MSTERMDSNKGTERMDTGTARMDAGTARIGGYQVINPMSGGTIFAEGQTIVLNGNNCVIENLISMGTGEAVIYKIKMNNTSYALKHYKPNTPLSDTAKKVLAKIRDNPKEKIIKIIDIGNYSGQDFEIMEFAEGGTLSEYIRENGAIRDNKLKDVVKQINEGLQYLHGDYKIIYQDLKPENIFFRDAQRTSLVIADFGISSVMQEGSEAVEVVASNTDLYAAPELARKGNNTTVEITPAVDYFALGITMYELWLGEQPFKDIKPISRERNIRDKTVNFPVNMPDDCKALIQGLIDPLPKDRWRNEYVQKWVKGETLALDPNKLNTVISIVYDPPLKFGSESASNHKELAALMEKYPKVGKDCLYDEIITKTLFDARDVQMYSDIKEVITQYGKDQEAGLTAAIYTLDPERPFISRTGKICNSSEEIADAIMADSAHYMDDLSKPNAKLYVYITVTGGSQGKEAADTFHKFFKEYTPNRALTLVYLKLQSDGGIPLGSKRYLNTNELAQEKDSLQIDLIKKAVGEKDSPLLVWISDMYGDYFKSTDDFNKQSIADQFYLLGLLPFLSYKELSGTNGEAALQDLIDHYPGRSDVFETYVAQGLPLKGQILDSPIKKTPIDYVVCNYIDLSDKHGSDTVLNLIRHLHKLGADVNEFSSDGRCPLVNSLSKDDNLVKLLIELGANEDFVSKGGKICKSTEEIADAIMAEKSYYMDELKNSNTDLYLYLLATGDSQGKEFAENFRKYFREYSPERAIVMVYVQLQSDLGITIGSKRYQSLEELKQEKDSTQIDLIKKAINEKDSLLFGWISIHEDYFRSFKTIETFNNLTIPDQFYLLWLMPFLSYKELKGNDWEQSARNDLRYLIDNVPGSFNLFEAYSGQGLPLKGQVIDSSVKRTPVDYIVSSFGDLKKHGDDTIFNLTRLFCKLGADVNEYSSDDTCPLINAFESFLAGKNDLIKLLLELGADANQYRKFLDRRENEEWKIEGNRQRHEAENQRLLDEKREKERIERERQRIKLAKGVKIKRILTAVLIVVPISFIVGYCFYNGWLAFVFNRHLTIPDTVIAIADSEFALKQLTSVEIPDSVTSIGNNSFSRNGLKSIDIPESVTSIGDMAFSQNRLISINIPDSVTSIGDMAFSQNRLTGINIPDSVTSIGVSAFASNRLTTITIGANVTLGEEAFGFDFEAAYNRNGMCEGTYIRPSTRSRDWTSWYGNFMFQHRNGNISILDYNGNGDEIVIPAEINGNPITDIGEVFRRKSLTGVTIPGSIISISANAFRENQLTSVVIDNGVTFIGVSAFADNPVTSIRIGANVKLGDDGTNGILGQGTGFNTAYVNNNSRAGTYTRSGTNTTTWTRR